MQAEMAGVDGVMIGRAAYQEPALLLSVDQAFFGEAARFDSRIAAAEAFIPYVEGRLKEGVPLAAMTRHILGLFNGLKGARAFRRHLATEAVKPGADARVLRDALQFVSNAEREIEAAAAE
jgi:tRNA-dihydrouridine synthase A